MMPHRSSLALALLLCLAAGIGPARAQGGGEVTLNLLNRSAAAVRELYVTPAGDATWGRNRLMGTPVAAGGTFHLRRQSGGNCLFDLRAVFADGSSEERRGLNLCTLDTVAVGRNAASPGKAQDDPSFRLINRGTLPVARLYVTPAGQGTWGQNRLGEGGLPPAAATIVRIPQSGQCLFDLRVVFTDHKALEKRRADLCRITDLPVP